MIGISAGGVAAIIAAGVWGVLALVLAYMVFKTAVLLDSTTKLVDGIRQETVPLLSEVTATVTSVNKELDRVDGMVESAGNVVKSAERLSSVIEHAVSSPLIKVIAYGAGASRAVRRLQRKKAK